MQTRLSRRISVTSSSPKSLSRSQAKTKRSGHLTATASHIPRQKRETLVSFVANCDPPVSINEPPEKDTDHAKEEEQQKPDSTLAIDRPASPKDPRLGDRLQTALEQFWLSALIVALSLGFVILSYNLLDQITEAHLRILCLLFFLWNWGQRFADLRKSPHLPRSIGFLAIRLALLYVFLSFGPFQIDTFIFHCQSSLLPVCIFVGAVTAYGHWHLLSKSQPVPAELQKPNFEMLMPFITDNLDALHKVERRISLFWVFLTGVLVLPLLQEILYRGVMVVSIYRVHATAIATIMSALAYNMSRPFASYQQFLATLFSGVIWGCLIISARENILFPFVAHVIHNALLFAAHHRKLLLECL